MNKALSFPFGFSVNDNSPFDGRYMFWDSTISAYREYNGTAEVLTALPLGARHPGLTVRVLVDPELPAFEYWFKNGVADGDLIEKGLATALPAQIQTAKFQNLDRVFQKMGALGLQSVYEQFCIGDQPTNFSVVSHSWGEPENPFDEDVYDGVTPNYYFISSSTGGLFKLDFAYVEPGVAYRTDGLGTAYTGQAMTSNNVRRFWIDRTNRKLYFITNETTCFYILDIVANTIAKKTFTASGTTTDVRYHAGTNKVIVSTTNGFILYNLTTSTAVAYTRTSANYTGDLLPSSSGMGSGFVGLRGDYYYVAAQTGLVPATNQGLWKYNITTNVMTKVLDNTQYTGPFWQCGQYAFYRQSTTFKRMDLDTGTIKSYTAGTYTGDTIDGTTVGFKWDERKNSLMMRSQTTNQAFYVFDIATEVNTKYWSFFPEALQNPPSDVTVLYSIQNLEGLFSIPNFAASGVYDGNYLVRISTSAAGCQVMKPISGGNPSNIYEYTRSGFKVNPTLVANTSLLHPYNLIHKGYIDEVKTSVDLQGISNFHPIGPTSTDSGFIVYDIGIIDTPGYQRAESIWMLNGEETEYTDPFVISINWIPTKPKLTIFLLVIGGSPSVTFSGLLDFFDPVQFLMKSSAGVEWDGVTQTYTFPGDGLYKIDLTAIYTHPKATIVIERFPWSY
jgi:hypothetical protein